MARLVVIEVLGGPHDGKWVPWDLNIDCMDWPTSGNRYQYVLDEQWTGRQMRHVLRHVATVPR